MQYWDSKEIVKIKLNYTCIPYVHVHTIFCELFTHTCHAIHITFLYTCSSIMFYLYEFDE